MSGNIIKKIGICFICSMLVFFCMNSFLWTRSNESVSIERQKADVFLKNYTEKIQFDLRQAYNPIEQLEDALILGDYVTSELDSVAQSLLKAGKCETITVLTGRNVSNFYGKNVNAQTMVGTRIEDLNYAHSLAITIEEFVVQGPVRDSMVGKDVFLLIQPIYRQGKYWGEIAATLDAEQIISTFGLESLQGIGYAYELWMVDPTVGEKIMIVVSDPSFSFSGSQEVKFSMPTVWTLSLKPQSGWVGRKVILTNLFLAFLISFLFGFAVWQFLCRWNLRKKIRNQVRMDAETGLPDREGMLSQLDAQIGKNLSTPLFLMYVCLKNYGRIASLLTDAERQDYLQNVIDTIDTYVKDDHLISRTSEDSFAIVLYGQYEPMELLHMEKGLAVELLQKVTAAEHTLFLTVGCGTAAYPENGSTAEELLQAAAKNFEKSFPSIVPLYNLTEKCKDMLDDEKQVVFEEYPDEQVNALAKAIYKYYQKMQKIIFLDSNFEIGNRLGYQRDMGFLISYDRQRNAALFLVDICDFGKCNKLFSIHTGDEVLRIIIKQLTEIFGKHLFRINGDVFLGITLNKQGIQETLTRIETNFHDSFQVDSYKIDLECKIGVCEYPLHGGDALTLLENLQIALSYAKKDKDSYYKIYNDELKALLFCEKEPD